MGFENFDKIIYINLDHRKDREKHILKELKRFNVDKKRIQRITAHYHPSNGHKGCTLSHIDALDYISKNNFKNALILEDDCEFIKETDFVKAYIDYFFSIVKNWDIFLLGGKIHKSLSSEYPFINRILKSTCSHAYAIKKQYIPTLKNNFLFSLKNLEKLSFFFDKENDKYALDRTWNILQKKDRWYSGNIVIAGQKKSYSDIQMKVMRKDAYKLSKEFLIKGN